MTWWSLFIQTLSSCYTTSVYFHPWPIDPGEPPDEAFLRAVDSLDVVSQAPYGETVQMKLTLRNVSDGTVSFVLGGRPRDFEVSKAQLTESRYGKWKCGAAVIE